MIDHTCNYEIHYSYTEQDEDGLPCKIRMDTIVSLHRDKMKLYEKYVVPLDHAIMKLYDLYRMNPHHKKELLKCLKQLHEARETAIQAFGL